MLRLRVLSAAVALPVVVAATVVGGAPQALLALSVAGLAGRELAVVLGRQGLGAPAAVPVAAAILPVLAAAVAGTAAAASLTAVAATLVAAAAWTALHARRTVAERTAAGWVAQAALGAAWVGWPLGIWLWLRQAGAPESALYPLAVTWLNDTAAYLVGVRWGRRRLAPALSPKKSVEGAAAGLAAAAAAGWWLRGWGGWQGIEALAVALAVGVAGQLGDLWESALKRGADLKDAGAFLPGHGGALDRLDSLLFAIPTAALCWLVAGRGG